MFRKEIIMGPKPEKLRGERQTGSKQEKETQEKRAEKHKNS